MAVVGLLGTGSSMPRAARAGNFARGFPKRTLNCAFAAIAVTFSNLAQLLLAVALLMNDDSTGLTRALAFVVVALFASALARGWRLPASHTEHRGPMPGGLGPRVRGSGEHELKGAPGRWHVYAATNDRA